MKCEVRRSDEQVLSIDEQALRVHRAVGRVFRPLPIVKYPRLPRAARPRVQNSEGRTATAITDNDHIGAAFRSIYEQMHHVPVGEFVPEEDDLLNRRCEHLTEYTLRWPGDARRF